jgi:tetratricopeptide (TPR) repeat protein
MDSARHFDDAVRYHQFGDLARAEAIYEGILKTEPEHFGANNNLGFMRAQQGRLDEGLLLIAKAVMIDPRSATAHVNRANILSTLGRQAEAVSSYMKALAIDPKDYGALNNLGNALQAIARWDDAILAYDQIIALCPGYTEAYYNRGSALQATGRPIEAIMSYDRAVALDPKHFRALYNRGDSLQSLERFAEAVHSYEMALAVNPNCVEAWSSRGNALREMGKLPEALASYEQAISLKPDYVEAYSNKGVVLWNIGRLDESLESFDRAISLKPDLAGVWTSRGIVLRDLDRLAEAIASHDRAISITPNDAVAHLNKATCLLMRGDLQEGFRLNEWRKRLNRPVESRTFPQPLWTGSDDISEKTIFLYVGKEQGFGDVIHFFRYARLLSEKGAHVILSVPDALQRLLSESDARIEILAARSIPLNFDCHSPLVSLPLAFGTDRNSIPSDVPYIFSNPLLREKWAARIGKEGLKVGICWQGKERLSIGARSFPLSCFSKLAQISDVRLISLQKGIGIDQIQSLQGIKIEFLGDDFDFGPDAFIDTAAIMDNLDLVIAADTSIAHLAGAMGCPTWVALKKVPDWRWHLELDQSPWYPTMKLFRQRERGEWSQVFEDMNVALRLLKRV